MPQKEAIAPQVGQALVINTPHFFADPEFVAWLNSATPKFTWHQGGRPGDYSDVVLLVDPSLNGEGSEQSELPDHIWDEIMAQCRKHFTPARGVPHIHVRLTNLDA